MFVFYSFHHVIFFIVDVVLVKLAMFEVLYSLLMN